MSILDWQLAQLSGSAETILRVGYGGLATLQLLWTLPHARRFLTTEAYGGYIDASPWRNALLRPATAHILTFAWIAATVCIALDIGTLAAAVFNLVFARYFFLQMRWQTIARGMGAPGHMNQWIASLVMLLALARTFDASGLIHALSVLAFRVDFALIMILAGIYKITAGYAHGDGFERGLVNPFWGNWSKWLVRTNPHSRVYVLLNHSGYLAEIGCGLAFFVPVLAPWAALVLGLSFLGIAALIRLTFLAEMVALCSFLYVFPNDVFDIFLRAHVAAAPAFTSAGAPGALAIAAAVLLTLYLAVLPLAYAGMCYNFYLHKSLPAFLQRLLDQWCKGFGLILWRVFTADVINFYVNVRIIDSATGEHKTMTRWRPFDFVSGLRYGHVGEFICLTSVFTTLKYYPNDWPLFERRILRYARSVRSAKDQSVAFDYMTIEKGRNQFLSRHVGRFIVDAADVLTLEQLDPAFDFHTKAEHSPVHTGARPGSYAPAGKP